MLNFLCFLNENNTIGGAIIVHKKMVENLLDYGLFYAFLQRYCDTRSAGRD